MRDIPKRQGNFSREVFDSGKLVAKFNGKLIQEVQDRQQVGSAQVWFENLVKGFTDRPTHAAPRGLLRLGMNESNQGKG
jgi:hypothetical protein